jgi:ubiquinone/menaquinone biosynthesis C-methylase UbiE
VPEFAPHEITYDLFGIDPATFYATKFACGRGIDDALANPVYRYEIVYEKIRRLIADLRMLLPGGGRVLDIGCGAGPYGPTLLANVPNLELFGADLSEACLAQARTNGYVDCRRFNLTERLPYDDEFFDAVISMDVFGHIEFRHKDRLIEELARITRRGGGGHHGVETAFIDYFHCDPRDENDPVRRYVYVDGHVGAEPAADVCARFAAHFDVTHHITYLYPFLDFGTFRTLFSDEVKSLMARHDHPEAVQLANVLLGALNTRFLERFATAFGPALTPHDGPPEVLEAEHARARGELRAMIERHNAKFGNDFVETPRELFRPGGFSSITLRRPMETRAGSVTAGARYNLAAELARPETDQPEQPAHPMPPLAQPVVSETLFSMIGRNLRRRSPAAYRTLAPVYRALRRAARRFR